MAASPSAPPSSASLRPCRARSARHRHSLRRPPPARAGHIHRGPGYPANNRVRTAWRTDPLRTVETDATLYRRLVRGEAVKQAVAAGAPEVRLRTAAFRAAGRMRTVPGFRGLVVAQPDAVGVSEHR